MATARMVRGLAVSALMIVVVGAASCSSPDARKAFDRAIFTDAAGRSKVTLCFDLRDVDRPGAGVLLDVGTGSVTETHTLALPFESRSPTVGEPLYSTWGSYRSTSILRYSTTPNTRGVHYIGMIPILGEQPRLPSSLKTLPESVYFTGSGLDYSFVYKYPDADPNRQIWQSSLAGIVNTDIDAIAVALPRGAVPRGIGGGLHAAIPEPLYTIGSVHFFPANSSAAAGEEVLQLSWTMPPSEWQVLFATCVQTGILAMLAPLAELAVVLRAPSVKKRRMGICIIVAVQVVLLVVLLVLAYLRFGQSRAEAAGAVSGALLGAVFVGLVTWYDKRKTVDRSKPIA